MLMWIMFYNGLGLNPEISSSTLCVLVILVACLCRDDEDGFCDKKSSHFNKYNFLWVGTKRLNKATLSMHMCHEYIALFLSNYFCRLQILLHLALDLYLLLPTSHSVRLSDCWLCFILCVPSNECVTFYSYYSSPAYHSHLLFSDVLRLCSLKLLSPATLAFSEAK